MRHDPLFKKNVIKLYAHNLQVCVTFVTGENSTSENEAPRPIARHDIQPCQCKLDFGVHNLTASKQEVAIEGLSKEEPSTRVPPQEDMMVDPLAKMFEVLSYKSSTVDLTFIYREK